MNLGREARIYYTLAFQPCQRVNNILFNSYQNVFWERNYLCLENILTYPVGVDMEPLKAEVAPVLLRLRERFLFLFCPLEEWERDEKKGIGK